jgi:hypothetical protein
MAIANAKLSDGTNQMEAKAPGIPATAIPKIARSVRVILALYLMPAPAGLTRGPQLRGLRGWGLHLLEICPGAAVSRRG